jgi:hypothetical protein
MRLGVYERREVVLYYLIYFGLKEDDTKILATDADDIAFISLLEQRKQFEDARLPWRLPW